VFHSAPSVSPCHEEHSSAAGKTQLALQLSLFVQLPRESKGLKGSTCYLITSSRLPTTRLSQICETHTLLSASTCGLQNIHTISTPTIPVLIRVLTETLPPFINEQSKGSAPVKLLVIDALAELFHTSHKTTTSTLVERSRSISEISILLHSLASTFQIAILVLNEVVDVFDHGHLSNLGQGDLVYSDQSRWFGRMNSVPGEDKKEASLGLVWANQVNARILLSRTGRRRYLDDGRLAKRHRSEGQPPDGTSDILHDDQLTLVRRMSVIFNSFSRDSTSMDYIVGEQGISTLPGGEFTASESKALAPPSFSHAAAAPFSQSTTPDPRTQISPLDVGIAEEGRSTINKSAEKSERHSDEDEWDQYWALNEISDVHDVCTDVQTTRSQKHLSERS
jgi:DNA repair protein RAD57